MTVQGNPGYHTITPFLYVEGIPKLITFLKEAFGAEELMQQKASDGAIMHAEVKIGDSIVMMSERSVNYPTMPCMLYFYADDVDGTYKKALAAGATMHRKPEDQFYGDRSGAVTDPSGNLWWISKHVEDVSLEEIQRRMKEMEPETTK